MNRIIEKILKNNFVEYRKEKGHFEIVSEICSESSTPIKIGNNWYSLEEFSNTFKFLNKESNSTFVIKDLKNNKFYDFQGNGDIKDFNSERGAWETNFCVLATQFKNYYEAEEFAYNYKLEEGSFAIEELE